MESGADPMTHVPTLYEIETFTGNFVDTSNPSAEDIALEDIAHALSNICRYGGHCKYHYSVAQHAVFVSKRLERQGHARNVQLWGLHHDDAEAYLGDIPRPLKPLLGDVYTRMTDAMDKVIHEALGLPGHPIDLHYPAVKAADSWSLFVEARHLLPSEGRMWWKGEQKWGINDSIPSRIVVPDYWRGKLPSPVEAYYSYLHRHKELTD